MADLVPNPATDAARERRRKLKTSRRDETGFSTEAMPHLTAQQVKWIATRATVEDNSRACVLTDTRPDEVLVWLEDPDFLALYQEMMENKREGFKQLATQMLPQVLLALQDMLVSGNAKAMKEAATLLLRNQGLLVDKVTTVDRDAISALIEEIRRPRPVMKTLPNPKDYVDGSAKEI